MFYNQLVRDPNTWSFKAEFTVRIKKLMPAMRVSVNQQTSVLDVY